MLAVEDIHPIRYGDVLFEGEWLPMVVHVIEHPEGRVLVDTGMVTSHAEVADWEVRFTPINELVDVGEIADVINTHLHFDHCGGNPLFGGKPIHVQAIELADARSDDEYTIPEWVDFPGATYDELDGDTELLEGVRVITTPGHTRGHQSVVVETRRGLVVVGGDVSYGYADLNEPKTEGQRRVRELEPIAVWLAHKEEPWRPG